MVMLRGVMVFFYDEDFSAVFLFLGYPQFLAPVFQYFLHSWNLIFGFLLTIIFIVSYLKKKVHVRLLGKTYETDLSRRFFLR